MRAQPLIPTLVVVLALAAACGGRSTSPGTATPPPGPAAPDAVWLVTEPKQAGNPWDGAQAGDLQTVGYPIVELESVDAFFESRGVKLVALGLLWPTEPIAVCLALSCPRGDQLLVLAPAEHAARVESELGFRRVPAGTLWSLAPPACAPPWGGDERAEPPPPADEARAVTRWVGDAGAEPRWVGLLYRTERGDAPACGAPRREWVVVMPGSEAGAKALAGKGFAASP
jgi:hypothetical protein